MGLERASSRRQFKQERWSLADLLPTTSGTEFDKRLNELEAQVVQFEGLREHLNSNISVEDFSALMRLYESITQHIHRLYGYARLQFSADTQSQEALGFLGQMEQLYTDIQNRALFFSLWWRGLADADASRLMASSGDWRYFLESLRRFKPHTLTEPEEKIINLKNINGVDALTTLYECMNTE